MIKRIFIDLDGVLNRFTMPALKHVGCIVDELSYNNYSPAWGFDIIKAANNLHAHRSFTPNEFWGSFNREFWATLPLSNEWLWLLNRCRALVGEENVCILSSPTLDPDCLAGKVEWINLRLPPWMQRRFLIGPRKEMCAHPDTLLIDDSDSQVDKFREYGGRAILVPRPWNTLHMMYTEDHLERSLDYEICSRIH